MTGRDDGASAGNAERATAGSGDVPARRATVTTTHAEPATAERVAGALRPDNTAEMSTRTDGRQVVTAVERETTGGLQSTVDDYVVNLAVAAQLTTDEDGDPGRDPGRDPQVGADGADARSDTL